MERKRMIRNGVVTMLAACMIVGGSGCSSIKNTWDSMSQSSQGATAGGAIGAAVGTGVGAIIGGGRGTWIGALVGSAIGAGTGALVGNSMDRQQKALQQQLDQLNARADDANAREDSLQKQIECHRRRSSTEPSCGNIHNRVQADDRAGQQQIGHKL